jgi:sulfopyruvate decarboxylase subunit beta
MIERDQAFAILAEQISDEVVVTGVGSQTSSWLATRPRPLNLYLRGPMGLAPAVGLGVALAHPNRKVVVIEGDGGLLMGLTSLASVAHCQPSNLFLICMDNGIYEAGGMGATVNAGRTDFVRIVRGLGIERAISAGDSEALKKALKEFLAADACAFLHVPIGLSKGKPIPATFRPPEVKYQFQAALKAKFEKPR